MKNSTWAIMVRGFLAVSIVWSVGMMYYTYVVQRDYVVFTNPDGPNTTDY